MSQHVGELWWSAFQEAAAPHYLEFVAAEAVARKTEIFSNIVIDGLLQTEEYARSVLMQYRDLLSESTREARIKLRLKRQWHAFERPTPMLVHVILDESAIRRVIGSAQVQHGQLRHLATLAQQPHITLQLLPLQRGIVWPGSSTSMTTCLLTGRHGKLLSREQRLDHINTRNAVEIAHFQAWFAQLSEQALNAADTLHYLIDVAADLQTSTVSPYATP